MCISNNAGTHNSSMEVDDKISTNCKKQDQGHRSLLVEILHRNRSSSLKYVLSLYNSKNIYKQSSVCSPKPKLYPSSSAWYFWKFIHWEKVFLFYNKLWSVFVNKISYKGDFWTSVDESCCTEKSLWWLTRQIPRVNLF